MARYCTAADVYDAGLPRGGLPNPGRVVASVAKSQAVIGLEGHGLDTGTAITVRAEVGGALPAPLVAGQTYYAIALTDATFALSASVGGDPVAFTTDGTSVVVVTPLPIDKWIVWASNLVENFLPAHLVPLELVGGVYPPLVVAVTADLVAARGLQYCGLASADIQAKLVDAQKQIDRWARGVPLRGAAVPARANTAVVGSYAGSDPRGWVRTGGRIP